MLALSVVSGLPGHLWPLLVQPLVDGALLGGDFGLLVRLAGAMAAMQVVGLLLSSYTGYRYVSVSARALFELRLTVYRKLQKLSPRFFAESRTGDVLSRLNTDVSELQRTAGDLLLSLVSNVLGLAVSVTMVAWLAPSLLVPSLVAVPLASVALSRLRGRVIRESRQLREAGASVGSLLVESILGLRQTVAFGQQAREAKRFGRENDRFIDALLQARRTTYVAAGIPSSVVALAGAATFLYGGFLVMEGALTLGTLGAAMIYQGRLFGPIQGLIGQRLSLQAARASLERVFHLLDQPDGVRQAKDPVAPGAGPFRLDRVGLAYGRGAVLDGLSLTLPERSLTALLGHTGVGKTTVADLILRRMDPDSGRLGWGATDLRRIDLGALRRRVAVVEQEPFLFHDSILANIRYGAPDATLREVREAARLAALDGFLAELPGGLETVVGERGQSLSAGQRQRIAIARAVITDPALIVLDEPSSALDEATEALLVERLVPWLRERMALVMTHRPAFVEAADQAFALRNGRAEPM